MRMLDRIVADPRLRSDLYVGTVQIDPDTLDLVDFSRDPQISTLPFEITPIAQYYDRHYRDFSHGSLSWNEIVDVVMPPDVSTFWEWRREPGMFPAMHPAVESVGVLIEAIGSHDASVLRKYAQQGARDVWAKDALAAEVAVLPDFSTVAGEVCYTIYISFQRTKVEPVVRGGMFLRDDGRPLLIERKDDAKPHPLHYIANPTWPLPAPSPLVADLLHVLLNPALLAISMLNTKNVSPVILPAQEVPPKVAEKRRRKTGRDPFVYRTLSITPMGGGYVRRETAERGSGDADARRLHIARGHFKRFTPERPLFGRHAGTYWWNSQVRGDLQAGAVVKDYEIRNPKGE